MTLTASSYAVRVTSECHDIAGPDFEFTESFERDCEVYMRAQYTPRQAARRVIDAHHEAVQRSDGRWAVVFRNGRVYEDAGGGSQHRSSAHAADAASESEWVCDTLAEAEALALHGDNL